ncbi:hypothetical protein U1Q18_026456 [Sarracenia purpurea var. burkii]
MTALTGRVASASTGRAASASARCEGRLEPGGTSCVGEDWGRRSTTADWRDAKDDCVGEDWRDAKDDCRLGKTKHDCSWFVDLHSQ